MRVSLVLALVLSGCMHARGPSPSAEAAVQSFVAALARFDLDGMAFDENATVFMPLPSMPDRIAARGRRSRGGPW